MDTGFPPARSPWHDPSCGLMLRRAKAGRKRSCSTNNERRRRNWRGPGELSRRAPLTHQPACKPGLVRRGLAPPRDGHSSAAPVARRLKQPTRTARSGHRSRSRPALAGETAPSLFGLAPGGVCRAVCIAAAAVRSYRTVSPLPSFARGLRRAVCSLWHFPWARARRTLSGTVCPWSPDFPPAPAFRHWPGGRPAD